jgi:membrane protein implicated in regulation of membrane protease activity
VSDQPLLNRKSEQLIGKVLPLHQAIVNGQGRVKLGDALWTVDGPDLPAGTQVRVIGATSMILKVEPAE